MALLAFALAGCLGYPPAYEPMGFLQLDSKLLVSLEPYGSNALLRLKTEKTYACEMIKVIVVPTRVNDTLMLEVQGLDNSICAPAYGKASWPLNEEPLPQEELQFALLEQGRHSLILKQGQNEDEYLLVVEPGRLEVQEIRATFSRAENAS